MFSGCSGRAEQLMAHRGERSIAAFGGGWIVALST